ncbi:MAG: hypothetical protein JO000_05620 [Alphaproteobacteria bacterium]|nr:hypothetical protein [Alphaproteobacteria bacterium]
MTAVRRAQLIRSAVWASLAVVAMLAAFVSARTDTGVRRIAAIGSGEPPAAPRGAKDIGLASRQFDQEAEQRRINDAIRSLAADRDRLLARLNTLERSLDDATGSIGPARSPAQPAAGPTANPAWAASPPAASAPAPSPAPTAAAPAASPSTNRVAAGHLATGLPTPAESVATKTEFGIDLGSNATVEGVKTMWASLKAGQPGLLEGLRPVVSIREVRPGVIELRLIAGPLANASVAARLCAALSSAGQNCQPAVFDGQRLALQ